MPEHLSSRQIWRHPICWSCWKPCVCTALSGQTLFFHRCSPRSTWHQGHSSFNLDRRGWSCKAPKSLGLTVSARVSHESTASWSHMVKRIVNRGGDGEISFFPAHLLHTFVLKFNLSAKHVAHLFSPWWGKLSEMVVQQATHPGTTKTVLPVSCCTFHCALKC